MKTKVIMPQMGESIFEGTITKWLKKVGDRVEHDEPLFEISTDKVDSEIPAPTDGILSEIMMPEGTTVQVNAVLAIIDNEAKVAEIVAGAQREEPIAPAITAAGMELRAGNALRPQPEIVPARPLAARAQDQTPVDERGPSILPQEIRASPLVRRLARENNLELAKIPGTGLQGRITKDDVLNFLAERSTNIDTASSQPAPGQVQPPVAPLPPIEALTRAPIAHPEQQSGLAEAVPATLSGSGEMPRFWGEFETLAMTPMRKAIAERMVLSRHTSAHVTTVFEVDMTPIANLKERHKAEFESREGIALTYTPFFAKALVDTVRDHPAFNSSVIGDSIILKKPIHLGIAIALPGGLIVPVVRDAQLKSFTGLALAIHDLADRARSKKLKPDEVQNGTISITNPGSYGALFGTPIINQPQVAILSVGGIVKRPVVINDGIAIRSIVFLSLSFDHRVIDGAVADQFMAQLKERLQGWRDWE